jgi:hypothetical protein
LARSSRPAKSAGGASQSSPTGPASRTGSSPPSKRVSTPPPSEREPESESGGGIYIIGIAILALLGGGLAWWKLSSSDPQPQASSTPTQPSQAPPPIRNDAPPPPPPPPPEESAAPSASASASASAAPGKGPGGPVGARGPCAKCGEGKASNALTSAIRSAAQSAQGCYNRALRQGEATGSMSVSVSVGSTGSVCSASIGSDTVNNPGISSCVLGRFQGKSFPPPEQGCVVVNVPISFATK